MGVNSPCLLRKGFYQNMVKTDEKEGVGTSIDLDAYFVKRYGVISKNKTFFADERVFLTEIHLFNQITALRLQLG